MNQEIIKSKGRKKGFFEEGSSIICSCCGESVENSIQNEGFLICYNCGNQSGRPKTKKAFNFFEEGK